MSGPTTRVLAALELLQSHQQMSGSELAERLGVDPRTVRRYISVLEELGIPVMTEQGRFGGYRLVAGFKLPPMMFTEEESLAVSLGLLAAQQLGLAASAPSIASVQAKLERVMPANLKRRVRGIVETTRVVLPKGEPTLDEHAPAILTAAAEAGRCVTFLYHPPQQAVMTRIIDPYGLVFMGGRWYVIGNCHLRCAIRSFRLDRISQVALLADYFQRPSGFDAADYLRESMCAWGQTHEVTIALHTDKASALKALGLRDMNHTGLEQVEDGMLLRTHTDSFEWFAWWLAQLPFRFSVLAPSALKRALQDHANRLLEACH
ncbi:MAG: transcriptional regulator [unclassified Hahellaceae]|nr:transcriptional regulator [Hahellaceae bacterium]|tara:strand:- start:217595 stop:218551 length:957 start_codon:yes stop_codon:yes gene_type:complete